MAIFSQALAKRFSSILGTRWWQRSTTLEDVLVRVSLGYVYIGGSLASVFRRCSSISAKAISALVVPIMRTFRVLKLSRWC